MCVDRKGSGPDTLMMIDFAKSFFVFFFFFGVKSFLLILLNLGNFCGL